MNAPRKADEVYVRELDAAIEELANAATLIAQSPDATAHAWIQRAIERYRKAEHEVELRGGR